MAEEKKPRTVTRRALLAGGAAVGSAAAIGSCKYGSQLFLLRDAPRAERQLPAWENARVVSHRPLGRTGFAMSDISFGCAGLNDPQVVRRAIERGINYFDTSPDYSDAASERALGEGIRGTARDTLFIVSKFCTPDGHLPTDVSADAVVAAVESSLRRLGTDYLDLVHIHAVNSIDRLMAPGVHEAFDRLRSAGKVRFLGVSSHTPDLETVMRRAVDSGRFDVIMVAYNFRNWPDLHGIFHDARERGVGVVAMKTLKGARHTALADFTPSERQTFAQAAFKWVLANPDVSGLVVSISHFNQIDEYLFASGQPLEAGDQAVLEKYDRLVANDYCRPGCGACLPACPYGVPIDDVLRYQMYAEAYGREKEAMRKYARLGPAQQAAHCLACAAPCQAACEFDLPVRDKLVRAHRQLSWATS